MARKIMNSNITIDPLETSYRSFHICVKVETALRLLQKGTNLFEPATAAEVLVELTNRRNKGITYITGCHSENKDGQCKGHRPRKQDPIIAKLIEPEDAPERKRLESLETKILRSGECPSCVAGISPHRNCILR